MNSFGNFNFWGNTQQNNEANMVKITETMRFDDLPSSIQQQFVDVKKQIVENRKYMEPSQPNYKKRQEPQIFARTDEINEQCSDLFSELYSIAHQIDNGEKTLNTYKAELEASKSEINNVDTNKSNPSSFLVRYSKQLEDMSESISEQIEAYRSYLKSISENSNNQKNRPHKKNDVIINFLNEENNAILRSSTKISKLCQKLSQARITLCQKLKIDQKQLISEENDLFESVYQSILTKYRLFRENQQAKLKHSVKESDLFGQPTKIEAQTTGFGNNLFSTTSFTANRSAKNNSNNSNFAPPPISLNTNTTFPSISTSAPANQPPPAPTANDKKKNPFAKSDNS